MERVLLGSGETNPETTSKAWEAVSPRSWLRPAFHASDDVLAISGDHNRYEFGYWRTIVPIDGGASYTVSAELEAENIGDVSLHVLNMVLWRRPGREPSDCPHDYLSHLWADGTVIRAEETFTAPADATEVELQLGLRFAPDGRVTWRRVALAPAEPAAPRVARLSAVRWRGGEGSTLETNRVALASLVDQAAAQGSDLVLLPEYAVHNDTGLDPESAAEPVPDGPTCGMLARKAREHAMYICAGLVERSGQLAYNTTVLFDREGDCVGAYRKVHLYWPEEMWHGLSPGEELPVFQLDFGTVAIMTCYDSWFPETARLLALKGAEVILFPSAGYHPPILPARAVDNRAYVVASSLGSPAMVVDTVGTVLAETTAGLITVPVDVALRPTPHPNSGGSLNTSPGGRRGTRNSMSGFVHEELAREIRRWDEPAPEPQLAGHN